MKTPTYREPRRRRDGRSPRLANRVACLILGLTGALVCAGLALLWSSSPIGSVPVLTPMVQAILLGLIVARLLEWFGARSKGGAVMMGLVCGAASLAALHVGHYAKFVLADVPRLVREEPLPDQQKDSLLRLQRENPWVFADQLIFARKTGRVGFPGFMALRNHIGESIGGRVIRDWPLWWLWGFEGVVVVLIPGVLAIRGIQDDK